MGDLSELFAPSTVAVVGATEREGSVGRAVTANLLEFDGEVVPVNPNKETVFDHECYPDLGSVPDPVDLAVVVVPAAVAVEVVRDAGAAGIENVVVLTAGFGEAGSKGATRERKLRETASEYGLNLVGPNSVGVMSTSVGMNATFGPESARDGSISFMSQSGAFITAVLDWANDRDIGFRDVVSLGNKAVLDERDFVEAWGESYNTDVIIGYLEDIADGGAFIETAQEVTQETPIVVVKSGRTEAGAQAASSHTGAIAGSERAYEAGLEQAGVIRAETVEELFDAASMLDGQPLPENEAVAVITNAGGPGVLATDAVGDSQLELASFADDTLRSFEEVLPEEANIYNPVDVLGDAAAERFSDALDMALSDANVGAALVLACPTAVLSFEELAEITSTTQAEHDLPVAACLMGGESTHEARDILDDAGIPTYFDPSRAVTGLASLARYREISTREYEAPASFDVDHERARDIIQKTAERPSNTLGVEAMDLLDAYGIPTPQGAVVDTPTEAERLATDIDGDVVMKIASPDIQHKSDIGGVRVGVSDSEVADAYEDLIARAKNYQPNATLLGVQLQEQVDLDTGTETIVGMNRDPQFGPLLLFGLGGIFVETLEDVAVRVAPVSEPMTAAMVDEIDAAPLLRGARGRDPVDETALVETLQRVSQLVTDFPVLLELDINPLVATPEGVVAVDLAATIDSEELDP
ncbi:MULTISPECIES: acetate--CoA ligase family protein [Halococcus]|uniref:acetate--CoA ligase (ADP-forming) n=1 Tax=Halococcus salifodinae DSM 8989 TaxID=1227456 RepID=M0MS92_9EURY|nr:MULTISPECIES: acetate--CoA ligase [Halococcus]EMA48582.1 acyl-CoA synthetase [Halococcus salifodinae DSM 8989]